MKNTMRWYLRLNLPLDISDQISEHLITLGNSYRTNHMLNIGVMNTSGFIAKQMMSIEAFFGILILHKC